MSERSNKIEDILIQDIKGINEKLYTFNEKITDIKVSLQDLKSKQNFGMWLIKSMGTIVFGLIGGILGIHFHNFKIFK
jgi:hypothetical protein